MSAYEKFQKVSIQVIGAGITFGVGAYIGGLTIWSGPGAIVAGTAAAAITSTLVTMEQESLYKEWGLQ